METLHAHASGYTAVTKRLIQLGQNGRVLVRVLVCVYGLHGAYDYSDLVRQVSRFLLSVLVQEVYCRFSFFVSTATNIAEGQDGTNSLHCRIE